MIQIQYHLEDLINNINLKYQNNKIEEKDCIRLIHKYCMYFLGNKNHLKDYRDNKITIIGLMYQLIDDICNNQSYAPASVPVPSPVPVPQAPAPPAHSYLSLNGVQRINISILGDLISDLSNILYGKEM